MNTTLRTLTVSAGAVAVLGLAGTAAAADLTTADHHQAVAAVAQAGVSGPGDQAGTQLQTQPGAVPATYANAPQQVDSSAAVGVGVGTTGVILLGFLVWYAVKHHSQKPAWIVVAFLLGVTMSGSAIGTAGKSLVNSGVQAVSSVTSGLSS
jgi:hypothetical protein